MESYIAERTRLIESAPPGVRSARQLSDLTDEAVRDLARTASSRISGHWALVALGGWGFGQLLPASDLDVLVLSEAPVEDLRPFVEAVLYPLWDGGLKVGHQVRSPKQQLKAMRDDLKSCTATLTARPFAGDTEWASTAVKSWLADARKRRRHLLAEMSRRERHGSPYLLECDLKGGAGGRRDYDELVWTAAVLSAECGRDIQPLTQQGLLTEEEAVALTEAAAVVSAGRWELQRTARGDRLTVESGADLTTVSAEQVQHALAITSLMLSHVRDRLGGREPDTGDVSAEQVLRVLDGDPEAASAWLEHAAEEGRLDALVPDLSALMTCRRPGLGHELTVGAHSIKAASLALHAPGWDRALARSVVAIDDPRVLLVAALVHDAGKLHAPRDHAEAGAALAKESALRFGLPASKVETVVALVRLHLLPVETALRDDLDDEDAILRCAARIGDADLIPLLHALTAADSRATGGSTWTPWTASLVGTLVARLDSALSPSVDGAGLVAYGESVRRRALAAIEPVPATAVDFVRHASVRYLASRTPERVTRDAAVVSELAAAPSATRALLEVSAGPAPGTQLVTVAAQDRPELLARVSGAMALCGLDILSVEAYGSSAGIALDSFTVCSATARPLDTATFAKLERLVRAALSDRLELAVRLAERRKHYPVRGKARTRIETKQVGWTTELQVISADRVGLLHDIAEAVFATGLDIRWARVQTVDGVARDVFHISGPDGGPVTDPGLLGHLAMRIRESL